MANGQLGGIVRQLKSLLGADGARAATDGELLKRFAHGHDEAAFAALVERYAPLVSGVCRRTLANDHDAEDVFQATFLVLLRKASSLDGRGTVANWLYTVAYHLALKARARSGQRRAHERQVADMPEVETPTESNWNDLRPLLDEELDRLPDKYRSPMVLCYLTGKTNEQAAQELGWTKDTVRGRLARGREILRERLARRGITLTAAVLAGVLTEQAGQAAVSAGWVQATLQAGALFAAGQATHGISASVLALVHAGLKEVFFAKLKIAAVMCLVLGIAGTGVGIGAFVRNGNSTTVTRAVAPTKSESLTRLPSRPLPPPAEPSVTDDENALMEGDMMEEEVTEEARTEFPLTPSDPPELPKLTIKRRDWACEGELQKQLLAVPELDLNGGAGQAASEWILEQAGQHKRSANPHYGLELVATRTDLAGLPLRRDADCRLSEQRAKDLGRLSPELRAVLGELTSPRNKQEAVEPRLLPIALWKNLQDRTRTISREDKGTPIFQNPGAVATLMQMLTGEESPLRIVLVQQLSCFTHPSASEALARIAIFDLAPEVRAAAVQALSVRPRSEYRSALVNGFRYPWGPVADHAAEALVALQDREATPALKILADEMDAAPPAPVVREMVRINHLRNCLLCHAPSQSKDDQVRGRIPVVGQRLPPMTQYYQSEAGIFVRADITYLRQDFSVAQPVSKPKDDPWPDRQRYDYLVRTRPMTTRERAKQSTAGTSPQREALRYTVQELLALQR